ncbi:hypothetical protein M378DRAFT_260638 [Amanita muscaria Koide BX008]|uniref:Methyltransferase domain-containing protein n=1 Tax=Amanita muscaria (strain Koide BX008) TaxID=946122 RepID=A0A0C2XDJ6_AMAMK|nr:hypothetical protein M378DRAFT_260638 [Amanita muscaria Koide BX008]
MKDPAIVRDIQSHLSSKSVSRRRPGDSPYPLKFPSSDDINFDIWDHLFFVDRHCQRLTVHQFNSSPSTVLDLGCGTGFWAIQAAKQWPTASVTGYDMLPIQPDLNELDMHQDVADRIEWVHGNFLDGLPFRQGYFDFVRISKIGLGVPENERFV